MILDANGCFDWLWKGYMEKLWIFVFPIKDVLIGGIYWRILGINNDNSFNITGYKKCRILFIEEKIFSLTFCRSEKKITKIQVHQMIILLHKIWSINKNFHLYNTEIYFKHKISARFSLCLTADNKNACMQQQKNYRIIFITFGATLTHLDS